MISQRTGVRRPLAAVAAVALGLVLSGCAGNLGAAAVVNGTRIEVSDMATALDELTPMYVGTPNERLGDLGDYVPELETQLKDYDQTLENFTQRSALDEQAAGYALAIEGADLAHLAQVVGDFTYLSTRPDRDTVLVSLITEPSFTAAAAAGGLGVSDQEIRDELTEYLGYLQVQGVDVTSLSATTMQVLRLSIERNRAATAANGKKVMADATGAVKSLDATVNPRFGTLKLDLSTPKIAPPTYPWLGSDVQGNF